MYVLRQATNEDSEDWEAEMDGHLEPRVFKDDSFALSSTFTKFHRLPLPLDRIFLVDNAQSLRECTRALCVVSYALCCSVRHFARWSILELKISLQYPQRSYSVIRGLLQGPLLTFLGRSKERRSVRRV